MAKGVMNSLLRDKRPAGKTEYIYGTTPSMGPGRSAGTREETGLRHRSEKKGGPGVVWGARPRRSRAFRRACCGARRAAMSLPFVPYVTSSSLGTLALAVDESGSLGSKALLGKIGPISGALRDPGRRSTFYVREIRSPSSM